ncbi:uncharacterized protein LY89DRAFT_732755 [Mollisia scopiformis]|uniref:Uncharacterized protein n=1 Tax=Mollisia scopiformis TaxID=149040 RepID=A0A194XE81_MOLSC|nr:uncharacterized protein LY89DRAFT_732755 [Mollisia scopiformis]KUJ18451.1 hypothetical protein LY89DRAFT_732755 [Mollisia scopiformis]
MASTQQMAEDDHSSNLIDILSWFIKKIEQEKATVAFFQRCIICKGATEFCETCTHELDVLKFDLESFAEMACREIWKLTGGKEGEAYHAGWSFTSFQDIQNAYKDHEELFDRMCEGNDPITCKPRKKVLYADDYQQAIPPLECAIGNWTRVCKAFQSEYELGMARGWRLPADGVEKERGKVKYDPSAKIKKWDALKTKYAELAATLPPNPKSGELGYDSEEIEYYSTSDSACSEDLDAP